MSDAFEQDISVITGEDIYLPPTEWRAELSGSDLNIDLKTRSNLLPWRGQFSPQLIESLLLSYTSKIPLFLILSWEAERF